MTLVEGVSMTWLWRTLFLSFSGLLLFSFCVVSSDADDTIVDPRQEENHQPGNVEN